MPQWKKVIYKDDTQKFVISIFYQDKTHERSFKVKFSIVIDKPLMTMTFINVAPFSRTCILL